MSTWFKQVANNSLSYLNAQIEPLRHRQKYGKTSEEISIEIQNELQTTISREKDVERKIQEQEQNRKKIRSQHQELNFRVQNLDENRQFLFKQTAEYEQKLTNHAQKQRKLLMTIDKLKTQQNDVENIKLRSICLNLKGATELKEGTANKIPKLRENRKETIRKLQEQQRKHKGLTNIIEELSQKRASLRNHLIRAQKQHQGMLLDKQKQDMNARKYNDINVNENELIEVKDMNTELIEVKDMNDDEMITIFDNSSGIHKKEISVSAHKKESINNLSLIIHNLHCSANDCDSELEAIHLSLGSIVLSKLSAERDLLRVNDMLELQQETLQSIEESRIQYSLQQQKLLKTAANLSSSICILQNKLNSVKNEMKRVRDDIQAIKEASTSLSHKKFDLANKLKKTIDRENEIEDALKILQRNRMSLRSRKSQLIKQQISLYQESDTSATPYSTQNVKITRCDCHCTHGVSGALMISKEFVTFIASEQNKHKKYNISHEIIDISHSNLINYSSTTSHPQLLLYLFDDIPYQGAHIKQKHHANVMDNCYKLKIQEAKDKNVLLIMHNLIETKRDLLDKLSKNTKKTIKKNTKNGKKSSNFSIWDIEIEDEFYLDCVSGYEIRKIISLCPSRTHLFKWKLFYSTAIHGISMQTLYGNCCHLDESILIIKDSTNSIFGAFIDVPWTVSTDYRGSIDCFVFQLLPKKQKHKNDDDDKEEKESNNSKHKLIVYRSSGQKAYIIRNDMESITIGAGECPALYFDQDLNFGRSTKCVSFDSQQLSTDTEFQITTLEIWGAINI